MPWGNPGEHHDFEPQRHDDGCIEVIGFTMTSLVSQCCCWLQPATRGVTGPIHWVSASLPAPQLPSGGAVMLACVTVFAL